MRCEALLVVVSGRDRSVSCSYDGYLHSKLAMPGPTRIGSNPEPLLAAGW
jgi:organic hydroperoxide reductase OsmC/OhrA